jgi:hypothetical protein
VTELQILPTQETTVVPESQPAVDSHRGKISADAPCLSDISSPLTDADRLVDPSYESHHESAYFTPQNVANESNTNPISVPVDFKPSPEFHITLGRGLPSISRSPSSSTGDTMLLEVVEEEPKRIEKHDGRHFPDSSGQQLGPQGEANGPKRLPAGETDDIFGNKVTKASSKTAKAKKSRGGVGISSKHSSPRRLRSESQARTKQAMPLQERPPSDQNIPESPQGGMLREKYLPNSAAKRRFEEDEISVFSSSQEGSKRLRRDLSAVEIKSPSNRRGLSFLEQVTPATGASRLNHPSMPTGSRKGSIIGTKAPAPGPGQHLSKKSKKVPKTNRYSARFNLDVT